MKNVIDPTSSTAPLELQQEASCNTKHPAATATRRCQPFCGYITDLVTRYLPPHRTLGNMFPSGCIEQLTFAIMGHSEDAKKHQLHITVPTLGTLMDSLHMFGLCNIWKRWR